jgi:hypothetical protein
MRTLIAGIVAILFAYLFARYDASAIQGEIEHSSKFWAFALLFLVIWRLMCSKRPRPHFMEVRACMITFLTVYWITFDLCLNLLRGLPWHYVGTSSWIDKFGDWTFVLKILLVFFSFCFIHHYYTRVKRKKYV